MKPVWTDEMKSHFPESICDGIVFEQASGASRLERG